MKRKIKVFCLAFISLIIMVISCKKETPNTNNGLGIPIYISPANGSTIIYNDTLKWEPVKVLQGDTVYYDVYIGTGTPTLVESNLKQTWYVFDSYNSNTKYYWKIVAKDNLGHQSSGFNWNFTTPSIGDLQVFATKGGSSFDGVIVYVYFSKPARDRDTNRTQAWRQGVIVNADPTNVGCVFYDIPTGHYYIDCTQTYNGITYNGIGDCLVPPNQITKLTVDLK